MELKEKEKDKSNYNRAIKYTGLFGGVQVITLLTSILRNKLVAVILGPSGLGLISVYNSVIKLLNDSTNLGISFSAVKNISETFFDNDSEKLLNQINIVRSWSLLTALLGTSICIILASTLSFFTFKNYDHTLSFILLSPIVGMMAISGGELAILKGIRQLRKVAISSVLGAISTLIISIPLYYIWGMKGIILSLLLTTLTTTLIIINYSFRIFPFRLHQNYKSYLKNGSPMIKLGIAFIMAGVLGSGVEYIIRAFILQTSSIDMVGLYNAGYALTVTYAGMIFAAMETDYFPRLSAAHKDNRQMNQIVNQQIEIAILLISPLMVIFLIFLPIILPMFYSSQFLPVIGMAEYATFGMVIKAITLPIAYITLAKGDSLAYFILELLYDISIVVFIILGFNKYELSGTGIAITLAGAFDLIIVYIFARMKYKFRLSKDVFQIFIIQIIWIIFAFIATSLNKNLTYWMIGISCIISSLLITFYFLRKKTDILEKITTILKSKNGL